MEKAKEKDIRSITSIFPNLKKIKETTNPGKKSTQTKLRKLMIPIIYIILLY